MSEPGLYQVRFTLKNVEFTVADHMTILQGALQAGLQLPNSCRNGTCRTCIQHLQSGQIRYEIPWPGLSMDEKNNGDVLICAAFACSDLVFD
jgi:ferredoxin